MAGTKAGGLNAAETNKRKYGGDFYSRNAKKSRERWQKTPSHLRKDWGFRSMSKEALTEASRKGGLISRRGKKKQ